MKRQKAKHQQRKRLFAAIGAAAAVVVLGSFAAIALHLHHVHEAQKKNGTVGSVSTQETTTTTNDNKSQSATASGNTSDKGSSPSGGTGSSSSGTTTTPNTTLVAPYGTFVSNHKPGQNNSPTVEESECTTTPGATCDITLTNSTGVVKTLGAQTVGSSGTVSWNWNVTGSNLAPGNWKVTAVATLGNQNKSTTDATPLEIE